MLKEESGFTLIEMLIVLLIISVLIILIVPNLSSSSKGIDDQGCEALISVAQTQVNLFYLENRTYPANLQALVTTGYLTDNQTECTTGDILIIGNDNNVRKQ